jgi:hypothetical protein
MPLGRITASVASNAPMRTSSLSWMMTCPNYSRMVALAQTNAPSTGSGQATRRPASPTTTGAGRRKAREPVLSRVEGPRASLAAKGGRHAHSRPRSRLGPGWRGRRSLRRRESAPASEQALVFAIHGVFTLHCSTGRSRAAQTPVDFSPNSSWVCRKSPLPVHQRPVALALGSG